MVFSSITFLFIFLPVTLLLYYIVPGKLKNFVLLLVSLIFYAWGEPIYVFLMLYSILFNYWMGLLMEKHEALKKEILVFSVIINLFLLGFFKYYGFLVSNINAIFHLSLPIREIALPIGISFYTFQALSYIIDLGRGRFKAQKNFIAFATYITMFPQLIAGPIVRYEEIRTQMMKRTLSLERFGTGALRFIVGLSKKVLLANMIGSLFDAVQAMGSGVSVLSAWLGAVAFTFQIYFDFSGYSDMAIGLGDMLGFHFSENFDYPYASASVTDFWRRWHISLGTWFREYVYIPLGGNRVSTWKHIRNILVVWFLTGLWHGAAWNFVFWGLYYGILLLFEKYVLNKIKLPKFLRWAMMILAVIIGWVFFSANDLSSAFAALGAMFGIGTSAGVDSAALYYLKTYGILLILCAFFSLPLANLIVKHWKKSTTLRVVLIAIAMILLVLSTACLVSENYNPFLYFRF